MTTNQTIIAIFTVIVVCIFVVVATEQTTEANTHATNCTQIKVFESTSSFSKASNEVNYWIKANTNCLIVDTDLYFTSIYNHKFYILVTYTERTP